jgi:hypothetical protein
MLWKVYRKVVLQRMLRLGYWKGAERKRSKIT